MTIPSRREFLRTGGLALAGFGLLPNRRALAPEVEVIEMRSDRLGARVWFDPIGLYVEPGTTVRWIVRGNGPFRVTVDSQKGGTATKRWR